MYMKKFFQIMCVMVLIVPYFYIPEVNAQTLGDLKKALEQKQIEYNNNKNSQAQTQEQIAATNASIEQIRREIEGTYADIEALGKEIQLLNEEIAQKDQEMKDIINFVQVSNGESAYLEYAFGAQDFTDFIYRMAISEQLMQYNESLIDEYNSMIQENQKKQKEIEEKRVSLTNKQTSLQEKLSSLGKELEALTDTGVTIEEDLKYQKEIIELYEKKGCEDDEDIRVCGVSTLPAGTAMFRPLVAGYVTSEWGWRNLSINNGWHEGIDMATGANNHVNVYAVGYGMVAKVMWNSCGGNMVIVHHNINNKRYTTVYAHLYKVYVSEGKVTTMDTIVGLMGGDPYETGDRCSTGAHSHLTVATGWYGIDYYSFSAMNYQYSIDPRTMINFPSLGRYFDGRYVKY